MNKYLALLATVIVTSSLGSTKIQAKEYNPGQAMKSEQTILSTGAAIRSKPALCAFGTAIKSNTPVCPSQAAVKSEPAACVSGTAMKSEVLTCISSGAAISTEKVTTKKTTTKITAKKTANKLKKTKVKKQKYKKMQVPRHNNFKSYMGYRSITCKASKQYKLQQKAKTGKYGIRTVKGRYLIAMGTYYSKHIGDKFDIKLSDGTVIKCMIGDIKSDRHTDAKRQKQKYDGSIIEFISDPSKMPSKVKRAGSYTACKKFSGYIKEIRKLK